MTGTRAAESHGRWRVAGTYDVDGEVAVWIFGGDGAETAEEAADAEFGDAVFAGGVVDVACQGGTED